MAPASPCTGSMITAAMSLPTSRAIRSCCSTASASPKGTWNTLLCKGMAGRLKMALPVRASEPVVFPWKPRTEAMKPLLRVYSLASFMAPSTASVPLPTKKLYWMSPGVISANKCASIPRRGSSSSCVGNGLFSNCA